MKKIAALLALSGLLLLPALAGAADRPAPIKALEAQGMTIVDTFDAPDGLTGYAATYHGQPMAVYVTRDGQHALVGTLLDANGNDLSEEPLQKLVANPKYQKAWAQLEDTTWISDGADNAPRIIYMFIDPNCPYCHHFWQMARPWVKAGKVQIRHVLVAILKPDSLPKAAAILSAKDPARKLDYSERHYDEGGIPAMKNPPAHVVSKIGANTDLMQSLGFYATPTLVYKDKNGDVRVKQGVPQGEKDTEAVMGSPKP